MRWVTERLNNLSMAICQQVAKVGFRLALDPSLLTSNTASQGPG